MGLKSLNRFQSWFYCFFYGTFGSQAVGQFLHAPSLNFKEGKLRGFWFFIHFTLASTLPPSIWLAGFEDIMSWKLWQRQTYRVIQKE